MILGTAARQVSLAFTISQSLLKLMSIKLMTPSHHLILCHLLLLLPSIFPRIRVFSNELALCIRWPKYQSFSFSISPSSECSGLISFRVDWFISVFKSDVKYNSWVGRKCIHHIWYESWNIPWFWAWWVYSTILEYPGPLTLIFLLIGLLSNHQPGFYTWPPPAAVWSVPIPAPSPSAAS